MPPTDTLPYTLTLIHNHATVCYQFATASEFPPSYDWAAEGWQPFIIEGGTSGYRRLAPILNALIFASLQFLGLPSLTRDNLHDWLFRLDMLYAIRISVLTLINENGQPFPHHFTVPDLLPYCGLLLPSLTPIPLPDFLAKVQETHAAFITEELSALEAESLTAHATAESKGTDAVPPSTPPSTPHNP